MKATTRESVKLYCKALAWTSCGVLSFAVLAFTSIVAGSNAVEVIKAVAWPATVLIVVLLLLEPLTKKILEIAKLRHKDTEIEFGETLKKAEREADDLPQGQTRRENDVEEVNVGAEPHVEVIGFWIEIERRLRSLARSRNITTKGRAILGVLKDIERREILDRKTLSLIHDLRMLRNIAAHPESDQAISREQASRYEEVAWKVLATLDASKR